MNSDPLELIPALAAGDDFEQFVWGLLCRKYPQDQLVYIPATLGGDYGLEGYSKDGIGYQCYADQDSLSLRARTEKQKNKLYDDTAKLKRHAAKIEEILDGLVLENYFLIVPQYHAAELVTYANKRAKAVREYGLAFIHEGFSILIKRPEDYPAEYQSALADGQATLLLPDVEVADADVEAFPDGQTELADNLTIKLEQLKSHHPHADVDLLRERLIRMFLVKEQLLGSLRAWPETFEAVERQRQLRQEQLEAESALSIGPPHIRLSDLLKDYTTQLTKTCAGLRPGDAQRLAHGQAGEWLMRCPMKFQAKA